VAAARDSGVILMMSPVLTTMMTALQILRAIPSSEICHFIGYEAEFMECKLGIREQNNCPFTCFHLIHMELNQNLQCALHVSSSERGLGREVEKPFPADFPFSFGLATIDRTWNCDVEIVGCS
jgi:hypothetical protein